MADKIAKINNNHDNVLMLKPPLPIINQPKVIKIMWVINIMLSVASFLRTVVKK